MTRGPREVVRQRPDPPTGAPATWQCSTPACGGYDVPVGDECPLCGRSESRPVRVRLVGATFDLVLAGDGPWVLGREATDSPQLVEAVTVSRLHVSVARADDGFTVSDLESTNGTYVDGVRVARGGDAPLRPGSRLGLGRSVELHVEIAD
jgi:hypothetical protein